jgi:hypothetical protein
MSYEKTVDAVQVFAYCTITCRYYLHHWTGLAHSTILKWMLQKYGVDLIQLAQDRYQRWDLNCVTIVYKPIIQNQTLPFLSL